MEARAIPNCVACAVGLMISFSSITAFPCISLKCAHNTSLNKINVVYSKLHVWVSSTLGVFLTIVGVHYMYSIMTAFEEKRSVLIIITLLTNFLFSMRSSSAIVVCLLQSGIMVDHFKALDDLIQNWKMRQNENLLEIDTVRDSKKRTIFYLTIMVFSLLTYATYLMIINFEGNWNVLQKFATIVCFYVDAMIVMIYAIITELYTCLFSTYQGKLKNDLLKHIQTWQKRQLIRSGTKNLSVPLNRSLVLYRVT